MQASLALSRGTLFVGTQAKTARVRAFDLVGRQLAPAFEFRDEVAGRSAVSGMALDADRSILIADTPADRVRRFSLFGREVGGIGSRAARAAPVPLLPGLVTQPVDVEVHGNRDQGWIAVACGGEQRHAVQLFDPDFGYRASCAPFGEPQRFFRHVCRLAAADPFLFVAESQPRCIQVFRGGEFLFAFHLTTASGERYEPSALAAVGDGRLVVGCRSPHSALFLVEGSGRPLRRLAIEGEQEGAVLDPSDVVIQPGVDDRSACLFVIDRDGQRVQLFTLEGRCLGTIPLEDALGDAPARSRSKRSRSAHPRENKGGR